MATLTHLQLEDLWNLAGGDPLKADVAAAIAEAESGGCQYAKAGPTDDRPVKQCTYRFTTGENSYGLWQINRNAHPQYTATQLYGPLGNAEAAVAISSRGANFQPWSTYVNGAYKKFLQLPVSPVPAPTQPSDNPLAGYAGSTLGGYNQFMLSLARGLPTQLRASERVRTAALRKLTPPRRVR
jgi:hypothetical protein